MRPVLCLLVILCACTVLHAQDNAVYTRFRQQASTLMQQGAYVQAAQLYERALQVSTGMETYTEEYNAACAWAKAGKPDSAFKHLFTLAKATPYINNEYSPFGTGGNNGWNIDPTRYLFDEDLEPLRSLPQWQRFMDLLAKRNPPLNAVLARIYYADQRYRKKLAIVEKQYGHTSPQYNALWDTINKADSINLKQVTGILDKHGWPGADSIGRSGGNMLFLTLQHGDMATQQKYLPLMRSAVARGRAKGRDLALLEDRVAMGTGKPQKYGSQLLRHDNGKFIVFPLLDADSVDAYRRQIGLQPIATYLKNWDIQWSIEDYKNNLPAIQQWLTGKGMLPAAK